MSISPHLIIVIGIIISYTAYLMKKAWSPSSEADSKRESWGTLEERVRRLESNCEHFNYKKCGELATEITNHFLFQTPLQGVNPHNSLLALSYTQLGLAYLYGLGDDSQVHIQSAFKYFTISAMFGNPDALFYQAFMLQTYLFTLQNINYALEPWLVYESAKSELGDFNAHKQFNLTTWGVGSFSDIREEISRKAMLNYYIASLLGNELAIHILGWKYYTGSGVHPNCQASVNYYQKVAEEVVQVYLNETYELSALIKVKLNLAYGQPKPELEDLLQWAMLNYSPDYDIDFANTHNSYTSNRATGGRYFMSIEGNYAKAYEYFGAEIAKPANSQALVASLYYAAIMNIYGLGGLQTNYTRAMEYLQKIAGHEKMARNALGMMHRLGYGVPPNRRIAYEYFKNSSGDPESLYNMGVLFIEGGVNATQDYKMAKDKFVEAAQLGHTGAAYCLGTMFLTGQGVSAECPVALRNFKLVSEKGKTFSKLFMHAIKHFLFKDNKRIATIQYMLLGELGSAIGQYNAANLLDQNNIFNNQNLAIYTLQAELVTEDKDDFNLNKFLSYKYFKWSVNYAQMQEAMVRTADYKFYGIANSKNLSQAFALYNETAYAEIPVGLGLTEIEFRKKLKARALISLASLYLEGQGIIKDPDKAFRIFNEAIKLEQGGEIWMAYYYMFKISPSRFVKHFKIGFLLSIAMYSLIVIGILLLAGLYVNIKLRNNMQRGQLQPPEEGPE